MSRSDAPYSPLRVALAGAGMISMHHLIAWGRLKQRAEVVAICDPDLDRAQARASEFGIASVCRSAEELFARHSLDAIDIATPRDTHAEWVLRAADRKLAILCQKPLAPTLADAEALLQTIGREARLMVHENWRFQPVYRHLKRWIEAGDLGRIRMVRGAYLSSAYLPDGGRAAPGFVRQPAMRREPRLFIAEAFIHHIDVARYLCGSLRLLDARSAHTLADIPGETLAALFLETTEGAPVELFGNMAAPGYPTRGADEFDIIGDKASARVRGTTVELLGDPGRRLSYDTDGSYQACFDGAIAHFVDSLRADTAFETNPFDNIETLRLVEHAYLAAGINGVHPISVQ